MAAGDEQRARAGRAARQGRLSEVLGEGLFVAHASTLALRAGLRRHASAVDGGTLHYLDNGRRGCPVLLLLHGLTGDHTVWLHTARHLTRRFRVVVPDLPGHGVSPLDAGADHRVAAHAARI
ncbi:alpha/beta fold hydrolase, partial [Caldimonas sp.]|uniref:alpha/beta fold hydrolase n=1 Tax=Caldimonas sp. TaxID=2838790 RepID=UPI00391DF0BC